MRSEQAGNAGPKSKSASNLSVVFTSNEKTLVYVKLICNSLGESVEFMDRRERKGKNGSMAGEGKMG